MGCLICAYYCKPQLRKKVWNEVTVNASKTFSDQSVLSDFQFLVTPEYWKWKQRDESSQKHCSMLALFRYIVTHLRKVLKLLNQPFRGWKNLFWDRHNEVLNHLQWIKTSVTTFVTNNYFKPRRKDNQIPCLDHSLEASIRVLVAGTDENKQKI